MPGLLPSNALGRRAGVRSRSPVRRPDAVAAKVESDGERNAESKIHRDCITAWHEAAARLAADRMVVAR
ncbi:hypothetical protein [Nocardia sp. R6R-6]|uniref:hypothetical protein n=1 Tax=Nocardia sp. R6R-6 TaxID=3459303 RepID=UPI00403E2021